MRRSEPAEIERQRATDIVLPVMFRFPRRLAPSARHVAVTGSFNGWDPQAHRLKPARDGDWVITVHLPPGRVVYCFWVDGTSWLDPAEQGRIANGRGFAYSVQYVSEQDRRSAP